MKRLLTISFATFSLLFSANSFSFMSDGDDSLPNTVTADNTRYSADYPRSHATTDALRYHGTQHRLAHHHSSQPPTTIPSGERVIIINPRTHTWGAYVDRKLIRGGLASAGSRWCSDLDRPCRTRSGVFHIYSLGDSDCVSTKFPLGEGGAPMPYCMYFNGPLAIHGSHELAEANISHGCVRISVSDARWIRHNFAHIGTTVIVKPY